MNGSVSAEGLGWGVGRLASAEVVGSTLWRGEGNLGNQVRASQGETATNESNSEM